MQCNNEITTNISYTNIERQWSVFSEKAISTYHNRFCWLARLIDANFSIFADSGQLLATGAPGQTEYLEKCSIKGLEPSGPWLNLNMSSYQYRKSHCGDKTVVRPSYLHNGISYTGKMASFIESAPRCWQDLAMKKQITLIQSWTASPLMKALAQCWHKSGLTTILVGRHLTNSPWLGKTAHIWICNLNHHWFKQDNFHTKNGRENVCNWWPFCCQLNVLHVSRLTVSPCPERQTCSSPVVVSQIRTVMS